MRKTPDLLEMISYTFYFPAITSGPLFFFKDYEHFIVVRGNKQSSERDQMSTRVIK